MSTPHNSTVRTQTQTLTLPVRAPVPGPTPPQSGKHIDGCTHTGGFHDGMYEVFNCTRHPSVVVESDKDTTTVEIKGGETNAVDEHSTRKGEIIDTSNDNLDEEEFSRTEHNGLATPSPHPSTSPCPGCSSPLQHSPTLQADDDDNDAFTEIEPTTTHAQPAPRHTTPPKQKTKSLARTRMKARKVLCACRMLVAALLR